jgi:hypothetical protein
MTNITVRKKLMWTPKSHCRVHNFYYNFLPNIFLRLSADYAEYDEEYEDEEEEVDPEIVRMEEELAVLLQQTPELDGDDDDGEPRPRRMHADEEEEQILLRRCVHSGHTNTLLNPKQERLTHLVLCKSGQLRRTE